jgi:hypothetical protein
MIGFRAKKILKKQMKRGKFKKVDLFQIKNKQINNEVNRFEYRYTNQFFTYGG